MKTASQRQSPIRLLAVDDSKLVLEMIHGYFTPNGYEVVKAKNGQVALEAIESNPPDVIVADILMPVMDGWALYDEVRRRPTTHEVPFLFLTVEGELPQRLRGLRIGADDYLTKPFELEELHARVEKVLARKRLLDDARRGSTALLSGSVAHLSMSDLLQILSLNQKDGVVYLRRGEKTGVIAFEMGNIVHASCGSVRGAKALYRMLGWTDATFRVLEREEGEREKTIDAPATSALMDGLVSLDEWNRWKGELPDATKLLELAPDSLAKLEHHHVTPAELDVIARAKIGADVGTILEGSPLPDADLAEAICTLLHTGVLVVK